MVWPARFLPLLLGLACVTTAGCNDCDFLGKRCAGNTVEQCGHADQQIGRGVISTNCTGLNPTCVPVKDDAFCAVSAEKRCTAEQSRCEGNTRVRCNDAGFEVATDCTQIKIARPGQGLVPAGYVCNAPAGATPDCREP
jgi:hypothetical protein